MRKHIRNPNAWFFAQAAALLALAALLKPHISLDSIGYINYFPHFDTAKHFLQQIFSSNRTFGYPLFLKAAGLFAPELRLLPFFQYATHVMAVFIFFKGLQRFRVSGWLALFIASALLYDKTVLGMFRYAITDSLAVSFTIMAAGILMILVANPRSRITWAALVLVVFYNYQIRPSCMYLIGLAPALAVFLLYFREKLESRKYSLFAAAGMFSKLFVINLIPFVLFCSLRLSLVNDFGVVSFTGMNIIGIAGQLMRADKVKDLPEDVRPLAEELVKARITHNLPDGFTEFHWKDVPAFEKNHNLYIWSTSVPISQKMYEKQGANKKRGYDATWIIMNKKLTRLSLCIIAQNPRVYEKMVLFTFLRGVIVQYDVSDKITYRLNKVSYITYAFTAAWLASIALTFLISVFRNRKNKGEGSVGLRTETADYGRWIILVIALSNFALQMLLISLVEFSLERLVFAPWVFVHAALASETYSAWQRTINTRNAARQS